MSRKQRFQKKEDNIVTFNNTNNLITVINPGKIKIKTEYVSYKINSIIIYNNLYNIINCELICLVMKKYGSANWFANAFLALTPNHFFKGF